MGIYIDYLEFIQNFKHELCGPKLSVSTKMHVLTKLHDSSKLKSNHSEIAPNISHFCKDELYLVLLASWLVERLYVSLLFLSMMVWLVITIYNVQYTHVLHKTLRLYCPEQQINQKKTNLWRKRFLNSCSSYTWTLRYTLLIQLRASDIFATPITF